MGKQTTGSGRGKHKTNISKSVLRGPPLGALHLFSRWFANEKGLAGPRFQVGRLTPAAGVLRRAGEAAREQSGRQGALGAGLRGRKRWLRLRPVRGGKGKITGARGREGLRDWEEGT